MEGPLNKKLFARIDPDGFVGRAAELELLLRHARGERHSNGLALLAAPSAGTSELLRQVYDHLFWRQTDVIPFYFEIKPDDTTARNTARRFLREFLLQTVAFRRRDSRIIDASPDIREIAELALPEDGHWIDRLVETYESGDCSSVRNCLSAPLRAAGNGAHSFVMIDAVHAAAEIEEGNTVVAELADIFERSAIPFVFAGHRRFLFARTPFDTMPVEPLSFMAAGELAERLSARTGVVVNDQTRDLISVQLARNADYITSIFASAADERRDLDTFSKVEQAYTDEIFGGRIGNSLDRVFDSILPDAQGQRRLLALLAEGAKSDDGGITGTAEEFHGIFDALNHREIVNLTSGSVRMDKSDIVLGDYLAARESLKTEGVTRALAVGQAMSENARRAPQLMARFYRRRSSLGLRELMRSFDGRDIPSALIDYGKFTGQIKGAGDDNIAMSLTEGSEKITLPRIIYSAHTAGFYPRLSEFCDAERSAVAIGFTDDAEKDEVAWIAAEIDSKLEATRETAEFWCDRLEMAALSCNFSQFKLWLVAPHGFTADAIGALAERNAYGSSRQQALLLANLLAGVTTARTTEFAEYEMVIPIGEDTEMIAARAVEELAKRHKFPPKAINQIKTALVEACINAAEHSLSPDRRIHQRFAFNGNGITITVSNRGLRLADKYVAEETRPDEGRRGWGIKLMRGLMDDVKIERTDDGTRITMVKNLKS